MSEKEAVVQQLVQVLSLEGDSINTKVGSGLGLSYNVSSCIVHFLSSIVRSSALNSGISSPKFNICSVMLKSCYHRTYRELKYRFNSLYVLCPV